jgi:hypothetical protein
MAEAPWLRNRMLAVTDEKLVSPADAGARLACMQHGRGDGDVHGSD